MSQYSRSLCSESFYCSTPYQWEFCGWFLICELRSVCHEMSKAQLRTLSAFSCYSKNNIHAVARLCYQYLEFSIILCWFASLYSNSIHCACYVRFSFWNLLLKYDSLLILLTEIHSYFKSHLQINTATDVLYNFQSTPKILLIAS